MNVIHYNLPTYSHKNACYRYKVQVNSRHMLHPLQIYIFSPGFVIYLLLYAYLTTNFSENL